MKPSIKILALAFIAFSTAVSANNGNTIETVDTASFSLSSPKFINCADASLIESELGQLTKSAPSTEEQIKADLQLTETKLQPAVKLVKRESPRKIQLKKGFKN